VSDVYNMVGSISFVLLAPLRGVFWVLVAANVAAIIAGISTGIRRMNTD